MEENMKTEQTTQSENMGNETEVQGSAGNEKLFTQEEVNGFVQSRIARLKSQLSKEAEAEYSQKMADLQAREMKLLVKEKLSDRGMSKELADIITCTDEKDLDAKLDVLQKVYGKSPNGADPDDKPKGFYSLYPDPVTGKRRSFTSFGAAKQDERDLPVEDPIRKAMNLGRKD